MPASLDFTISQATNRKMRDHNEALVSPHGFELAIITVANGIAEYAMAYRRRHGRRLGDVDPDQGLGLNMLLHGLMSMLCGDVGRLDVRRMQRVIKSFASRHRLKFGYPD